MAIATKQQQTTMFEFFQALLDFSSVGSGLPPLFQYSRILSMAAISVGS